MTQTSQPTTPVDPPAPTRARAAFAAASFGHLRAAMNEGQALRLKLTDIDEDPDQPRTVFDEEEIHSLTESIRLHGVVQPIVVRPAVQGRYALIVGARRLRASRLAGLVDIPALIRSLPLDGQGDFEVQLIENQQRANLTNRDLAAAIARLSDEGMTKRQIAVLCALKDYQVAAFRQVENFPPELAERLNSADIRALYDLYRQWGRTPQNVIEALPDADTWITITEARRIIGSITGQPTGSLVLDGVRTPTEHLPELAQDAFPPKEAGEQSDDAGATPLASTDRLEPVERSIQSTVHALSQNANLPVEVMERSIFSPPRVQTVQTTAPVFIVALINEQGDGPQGRLIVDQRAQGEGAVRVAFADGVKEVAVTQLRFVRIE